MLQERNFPTFLTKLTPAPKLWFALGLILANILLKNLYFSIAVIIVSVVMIIKEKHMGLFKLILVTMVVMAVSMYGSAWARCPRWPLWALSWRLNASKAAATRQILRTSGRRTLRKWM